MVGQLVDSTVGNWEWLSVPKEVDYLVALMANHSVAQLAKPLVDS